MSSGRYRTPLPLRCRAPQREYINPKTNKEAPLICEPAFEFMEEHKEALDAAMRYEVRFCPLPHTRTQLGFDDPPSGADGV